MRQSGEFHPDPSDPRPMPPATVCCLPVGWYNLCLASDQELCLRGVPQPQSKACLENQDSRLQSRLSHATGPSSASCLPHPTPLGLHISCLRVPACLSLAPLFSWKAEGCFLALLGKFWHHSITPSWNE